MRNNKRRKQANKVSIQRRRTVQFFAKKLARNEEHYTISDVERILQEFVNMMGYELQKGHKIQLNKFGVFRPVDHNFSNLNTCIPGCVKVIRFKQSEILKRKINEA